MTTVDLPVLATAEFGRGNKVMVGRLVEGGVLALSGILKLLHVQESAGAVRQQDGQAALV